MQISHGHRRGIRTFGQIDRLDPRCSRGLARYKQELASRNSRFVSRWSERGTRPTHRETNRAWPKAMTVARDHITVPIITMRRTTQKAVSAVHIILRCHGVG